MRSLTRSFPAAGARLQPRLDVFKAIANRRSDLDVAWTLLEEAPPANSSVAESTDGGYIVFAQQPLNPLATPRNLLRVVLNCSHETRLPDACGKRSRLERGEERLENLA
jgi:hypothetical protein